MYPLTRRVLGQCYHIARVRAYTRRQLAGARASAQLTQSKYSTIHNDTTYTTHLRGQTPVTYGQWIMMIRLTITRDILHWDTSADVFITKEKLSSHKYLLLFQYSGWNVYHYKHYTGPSPNFTRVRYFIESFIDSLK